MCLITCERSRSAWSFLTIACARSRPAAAACSYFPTKKRAPMPQPARNSPTNTRQQCCNRRFSRRTAALNHDVIWNVLYVFCVGEQIKIDLLIHCFVFTQWCVWCDRWFVVHFKGESKQPLTAIHPESPSGRIWRGYFCRHVYTSTFSLVAAWRWIRTIATTTWRAR